MVKYFIYKKNINKSKILQNLFVNLHLLYTEQKNQIIIQRIRFFYTLLMSLLRNIFLVKRIVKYVVQ